MEKRILIAFIMSVVFVSFYNALILKPRTFSTNKNNYEQKDLKESSLKKYTVPQWVMSSSKRNSSFMNKVQTDDGYIFFTDRGIVRVIQRVEGSKDVDLRMDPLVGVVGEAQQFDIQEVKGNSVRVKYFFGDRTNLVHMIACVLPKDMDLPPRYARYYQGIIYVDSSGRIRRVSLAKAKKALPQLRQLRAVGLYSKYFISCLWMEDAAISQVYFLQGNNGIILAVDILPKGKSFSFWWYAGLGRSDYLKGFPEAQGFLKRSILSGISEFLWMILRLERRLLGDWGWTIVVFAILFSLAFMPLTLKSYSAMQKLQKLQPKIQQLQEKYKDDPQKLNQELIMLYATYGVNPFSGCLPLLLQLPVFFALYPVLLTTYEFKDASFLWIKSLAKPDVLFSIGPFEVHLLPLLVVALMFLQQLRSANTQQNKGMVFGFVIVFLIIFYNMPSGLVLFWLVNSVMGWIQQVVIVPRIVRVE